MTDSLLTVLHISDFHFTKRKQRDQAIVVDALVSDLKALCIGHRRPDLIIFTGDLVNAAGIDFHEHAYDFLLEPVSKATGCSDARIFIVPGNHDLSWKVVEEHQSEHEAWRELVGLPNEMAKFNQQFEAGEFNTVVEKKFSQFNDLDAYLSADGANESRVHRNAFVTLDHIAGLDIDLLTINTAAFSTGGNRKFERDERLLVVPEFALVEALPKLKPTSFKIFASHHPFAMLSEASARHFEGFVEEHADLHLFGHMHDPQPRSVVGLKGQVLGDQAGAIFTARQEAYIGYSLLTIERARQYAEVHLRTYFDDRKSFDAAIDLIEDGRWYSSQDARQHFRSIATPVDEAELRAHLAGPSLLALQADEGGAGGESDVHAKFVPPPLIRTFIQAPSEEQGQTEIESPVSFRDVISDDGNLILYAVSEFGRTTLLKEMRLKLLEDAQTLNLPRVPTFIDFQDIKTNAGAMLRLARGRSESIPQGHELESLLKLGHVCVLIDDVVFGDAKRMKILRDFVTMYPKARYVFSSVKSSATAFGAHVDPEMPVRFDFVEIKELKRDDMRTLLTKYEGCPDVEDWLDRLQSEFKEINLPFTAANGSILAEILQEKHKFSPVNRSVLIEQFIDSTLRKAAIEQIKRETFDYTNKTDLLAEIAAWMAKNDNYVPSKEAVRSEMARYINSMGLTAPIDDLMLEFLGARIFINRSDERISFRYRAVVEYFIALRMTSDPEFKSWVLHEDRYLQYGHEIQYYAGKLRNDAKLVDQVGQRYEAILSEVESLLGGVDLDLISKVKLPTDKDEESVEALYDQLTRSPLSKEEKDAELEGDTDMLTEQSQDINRPSLKELGDRLLLSLTLYSGMIKNMELISDADKRRHLEIVWRGWGVLLNTALLFAPKLARERRLRINGVMYEITAPHGMKATTLVRQIMLGLPTVHIRMIATALGSEKLERQLTEPVLSEVSEPLIYTMFRTGLIAELRLNATPGAVATAVSQFQSSDYFMRSLMTFLSLLRRHDKLKEAHYKKIESSLAGAIATIHGKSHKARRVEKGRQMTKMAKERLVIKMKKSRDSV